jgi:hypothetical protein
MSACIEHTKRIDTHGYGQIIVGERIKQAHRVAWEKARGEIPAGLCVLHRCDNRACVNVEHLFLGTKAENTADMFRKGRAPCQKGSKNPHAKLMEKDIPEIRKMLNEGAKLKIIASHFDVSLQTISLIKLRRLWNHV